MDRTMQDVAPLRLVLLMLLVRYIGTAPDVEWAYFTHTGILVGGVANVRRYQ